MRMLNEHLQQANNSASRLGYMSNMSNNSNSNNCFGLDRDAQAIGSPRSTSPSNQSTASDRSSEFNYCSNDDDDADADADRRRKTATTLPVVNNSQQPNSIIASSGDNNDTSGSKRRKLAHRKRSADWILQSGAAAAAAAVAAAVARCQQLTSLEPNERPTASKRAKSQPKRDHEQHDDKQQQQQQQHNNSNININNNNDDDDNQGEQLDDDTGPIGFEQRHSSPSNFAACSSQAKRQLHLPTSGSAHAPARRFGAHESLIMSPLIGSGRRRMLVGAPTTTAKNRPADDASSGASNCDEEEEDDDDDDDDQIDQVDQVEHQRPNEHFAGDQLKVDNFSGSTRQAHQHDHLASLAR